MVAIDNNTLQALAYSRVLKLMGNRFIITVVADDEA